MAARAKWVLETNCPPQKAPSGYQGGSDMCKNGSQCASETGQITSQGPRFPSSCFQSMEPEVIITLKEPLQRGSQSVVGGSLNEGLMPAGYHPPLPPIRDANGASPSCIR